MKPFKVVMKSPNQKIEDFEIDCDPMWTIGQLKDNLHQVYPARPEHNQQRIIYSGRLLQDHLVLKDVLAGHQEKHVMHLVCPYSLSSSDSDTSSSSTDKDQQTRQSHGIQPPIENVLPTTAQHSDMLRYRFPNTPASQFPASPPYPQNIPVPDGMTTAMASPYLAYQLAMQQTYAQFLSHALAQNQGNVYDPQQVPVARSQQPETQPQAANEVERPFRGDAANEEEGHNDFLDMLYVITRILMLCLVLYFYSTPGKVFLVLCLGFLFCMYRAFGGALHQQNVNHGVRVQNAREERANIPTEHTEDSSPEGQQLEGRSAPAIPSPTLSIVTVVKTFFTSLLPEHPLPIQT